MLPWVTAVLNPQKGIRGKVTVSPHVVSDKCQKNPLYDDPNYQHTDRGILSIAVIKSLSVIKHSESLSSSNNFPITVYAKMKEQQTSI